MTTEPRRLQAYALQFIATILLPPAAFAAVTLPNLVGNLRGNSRLIGCHRAAEHLIIDRNSHLSPGCTYTGGVEIVRSNVTFDCRGATIADPEGDNTYGIQIHAPASTPLTTVKVRNCVIRGFSNNFRVDRDGFRNLQPGTEHLRSFSRIELRNSRLLSARGSGAVVGPYVSDVRLLDLEVADSGGAGIHLEGGSNNNRILRSHIHDNGFGDVDPVNGFPLEVGGITLRYISTGREGLAIDGSRNNRVYRNRFEDNSYGAIMLYKNCGEYATQQPTQWWPRLQGADGNRLHRNVIVNESNGIWVGSRMSQNQTFFDCSDASYFSNPLVRIHEDAARRNRIQNNSFTNVAYAVRVEDDFTRVERNRFLSMQTGHIAVMIGTEHRTAVLGRPVTGTIVRGNRADIALDSGPYVWIHGLGDLLFERNYARGRTLIHQVVPPTNNFHLFFKELWVAP